jgi:hypothetical protein
MTGAPCPLWACLQQSHPPFFRPQRCADTRRPLHLTSHLRFGPAIGVLTTLL